MATKAAVIAQAKKYAAAIEALDLGAPDFWDEDKCAALGYGKATAGVCLENIGLGATTENEVETDFGYLKLAGMERIPGILAEPYASWLMLFYLD